jgi:hypothetical protein
VELWLARQRLRLPKTLVRSLGVVEAYELGDEPSEMPLHEDEHVVKERHGRSFRAPRRFSIENTAKKTSALTSPIAFREVISLGKAF